MGQFRVKSKKMKIRKILLSLFIIAVLICIGSENAFAMNTGFSTEDMDTDEQQVFLSNIDLTLMTQEPKKDTIECFDVNDNGLIAIGSSNSEEKSVCVYTSDGTFKYGYVFNCSQSFGIEWDNEYINIYFVRSDVIISVDSGGSILDIKEVQNTMENNTHSNNLLYSTSRDVGDTTYQIKNDMGILNWIALSYSQIVTVDAVGTECIIYDVSSEYTIKVVIALITAILFVAIVIAGVISEFIKLQKKNNA